MYASELCIVNWAMQAANVKDQDSAVGTTDNGTQASNSLQPGSQVPQEG